MTSQGLFAVNQIATVQDESIADSATFSIAGSTPSRVTTISSTRIESVGYQYSEQSWLERNKWRHSRERGHYYVFRRSKCWKP